MKQLYKKSGLSKCFLLLILLCGSHWSHGHGLNMATFEIFQEGQTYQLRASLDREDLGRSVLTNYRELGQPGDWEAMKPFIARYLKSNFQLIINAHCVDIQVKEVSYTQNLVTISAELPLQVFEEVKTIQVLNTCLIDYKSRHSNVIRATLNGRERSFLLNSDRIRTIIDYRA